MRTGRTGVSRDSRAEGEKAPYYKDPTSGLNRRVLLPGGQRKSLGALDREDLARIAEDQRRRDVAPGY